MGRERGREGGVRGGRGREKEREGGRRGREEEGERERIPPSTNSSNTSQLTLRRHHIASKHTRQPHSIVTHVHILLYFSHSLGVYLPHFQRQLMHAQSQNNQFTDEQYKIHGLERGHDRTSETLSKWKRIQTSHTCTSTASVALFSSSYTTHAKLAHGTRLPLLLYHLVNHYDVCAYSAYQASEVFDVISERLPNLTNNLPSLWTWNLWIQISEMHTPINKYTNTYIHTHYQLHYTFTLFSLLPHAAVYSHSSSH